MNELRQKFYEKYADTQTTTVRNYINKIDWSNRLIGVKGSRGVGKTTLLLQYLKQNHKPGNSVLYISLDDLWFAENKLYNLADQFYKKGGKLLVLDEVHRYPNWSVELKNIFDNMPELKLIFTGSSLLQLRQAKADLSRRAVMYEMPGLSFREFLEFESKQSFRTFSIDELIANHIEIAIEIKAKIKPLAYFENYLNYGYYPFYIENKKAFHNKLNEVILTILEVDIPQFEYIQTNNIIYLKKLLKIISKSVPFKPNMNTLSQRTGISLNTMKTYLKHLKHANLLSMLYFEDKGINSINKPEKMYLDNSNLMLNLSENRPDIGNLRETFFLNQLKNMQVVYASKNADFFVNNKYTFEIGGKNKTKQQIKDIKNSFIVKDNIEIGSENIIPLWLFGFLY